MLYRCNCGVGNEISNDTTKFKCKHCSRITIIEPVITVIEEKSEKDVDTGFYFKEEEEEWKKPNQKKK